MAQLYSKEQLREIFQSPFNQEAWKAILHNLFRAELIRKQAEKFTGDDDNEDGYFLVLSTQAIVSASGFSISWLKPVR